MISAQCVINIGTCGDNANHNVYPEVWEYNVTNEQFYHFQTLPNATGTVAITHFYFENSVYLYIPQYSIGFPNDTIQSQLYHFIFKWFVLFEMCRSSIFHLT